VTSNSNQHGPARQPDRRAGGPGVSRVPAAGGTSVDTGTMGAGRAHRPLHHLAHVPYWRATYERMYLNGALIYDSSAGTTKPVIP
jgi:hypothetical protein